MFLRRHVRKKDGKKRTYWTIVETIIAARPVNSATSFQVSLIRPFLTLASDFSRTVEASVESLMSVILHGMVPFTQAKCGAPPLAEMHELPQWRGQGQDGPAQRIKRAAPSRGGSAMQHPDTQKNHATARPRAPRSGSLLAEQYELIVKPEDEEEIAELQREYAALKRKL